MNENNNDRKTAIITTTLICLLLAGVVLMVIGRWKPKQADVVAAPAIPVMYHIKSAEVAPSKNVALKSLKVTKNAIQSAISAVSKSIPAGLTPKAAATAPVPPKEVIDLATKPAAEGGLCCPPPGCSCGKDCIYTDINPPTVAKNQDGSWNLKCAGLMDYNGKTTPLTSIFKWDRGSMVMVSEFQSVE
ncbi:MAG: hypothetical protein WCK75_04205 [Elusimicrobiota bacterium]